VEVTPKSIRIRKAILDSDKRRRAQKTQDGLTTRLNSVPAPPAM